MDNEGIHWSSMARVPTATAEAVLAADEVAAVLTCRDGVVKERPRSPLSFDAEEGPVTTYRREVTVQWLDDGRARVHQTVQFRLAVPLWSVLFAWPLRRRLGRVVEPPGTPWWLPTDRIDARAARSLAALATLALPLGYLGTLLTQTITYAGRQFHAGTGPQGVALAFARADVIGAVVLVAIADRRGRRRVLLLSVGMGALLTATGALAPGLVALTVSQIVSRAFVTAGTVLLTIIAVEEMPPGARAYAISLLAMASALGAGVCVMLLFVADLGPSTWRVLYLLPLGMAVAVPRVGAWLAESRRFAQRHPEVALRTHADRFRLLAIAGALFYLFVIPASEYQNQFLRTERHFSAARVSAFTLLTATPGGIGIVAGGRLADVHGRRVVAALALAVGSVATALEFLSHGWPLWAWSVAGTVVGAAVVPSLGVYGPELFPTSLRGRSNGLLNIVNRAGSAVGLLAVGLLSGVMGGIGRPLAALALAPAILAVVIVTRFPETAHVPLEVINPEDAPPAP